MADSVVDAGAPNLNLSPDEKRVYGQLFRQADTDNVGVVTGEIAVKFFEKTRLDSRILGEIWQSADKENRGFLTPAGFGIALRLIGHAQAGREPTSEIALQQGPLPRFDGISLALALAPAPAPAPAPGVPLSATPADTPVVGPLQAQGTGGGPIRIPPLTPEKVGQYASLFERQQLQAGNMLPGDQAKQIFEKSALPNEVLGRIWQLADTEQRGALVLTEFVIAMHLLMGLKTGSLRALPQILPAGLYEAATRRGPAGGPPRQQSPISATGPGIQAIPRQLSGQAQMRTGSPLGRSGPVAVVPQTTGDWLITPGDKMRFDQIYEDLDKGRKGFITGEEAVPFFSQSNLSEDALAQIWDLADINSEGRLTRDEFAVAMYLIRQQRGQRGAASALPQTLPPNLVPPSSRRNQAPRPATGQSGSPFDMVASPPQPQPQPQAPQPKPASALDDLFGLDTSPTPSVQSQGQGQTVTATGGSGSAAQDPFANSSPLAPGSPAKPSSPTATAFRPFVPSSSFGRTLTQQPTGDSTGSGGGPSFPRAGPSASDDLLGDADPEASRKISNDSVELANLSNQIGSLSRQMQDVQGQRTKTQNDLNQQNAQKKNFEDRLAQLRTLYEREAGDVRALEEQLNNSRGDTKKVAMEMSTLDGTCKDLQGQHQTVLAALQADQQENASLKERIRAVNAEIAQLKPQIERLRSEARQQKGLVAINKKQLATNEGERDRLKAEAEELAKSNEELARQISTAGPPAPASAQAASPAPSTASANNPFFRRTGSTDIMGAFTTSPSTKNFNDKSFDDLFGPSPAAPAPAPATASFGKPQVAQHDTGNSTGTTESFATPASSTPNAISRQPTMTNSPPALSDSRQMSSASMLPMTTDPAESSLTSSRQVSPPVSRLGYVDPASVEAPTGGAAALGALEPAATGQSAGSGSDTTKHAVSAPPTEAKPTSNGGDAIFGAPPAEDAAKSAAAPAAETSTTDPFSATDQAKAKEDFESAFASFRSSHAKPADKANNDPTVAFSTFHTEFPPISELERDDESDSDDERGGFDDDFAPASPQAEKKAESKSASPALSKAATAPAEAPPAEQPAAASDVPSAQPATNVTNVSAPKVDDIFGSTAEPHASDAAPTVTSTAAAAAAAAAAPAATTAATKGAFDDLDDDFEGLEEAKEGSADDDFATMSRSGLDDFNPVFDSSPPRSHANKSESNLTSTTATFGGDSSFDFGSLSTTSHAAAGAPPGSSGNGMTATDNHSGGATLPAAVGGPAKGAAQSHDWDAIFASLDDGPAPAVAGAGAPATKELLAPPPPTGATRPAGLGRALTETGEHDDPILKNLTGMGYARSDALSALEKYDYNLERAANYLASHS